MRRSSSPNALLWVFCCAFVAYGSLVPLEFRPLALDDAWRLFQGARVLEVDAEHRADWISNIVLYVPVGFLSAHALMQRWPHAPRPPLLLAAGAFSLALAGAVEFAQIFFPPRTVSLNDLFAEAVGSVGGIALAARYSAWFSEALKLAPLTVRRIDGRWLALYAVGYVALSLFPYDVILSADELELKAASSSWGWVAARTSQGVAFTALKLVAETAATLPIGWWLAGTARRPVGRAAAPAFGALLGAGIEVAQFFTLSGVSQGLSVLTRTAGVALGVALWRRRERLTLGTLAVLLRRHGAWLAAAYGLLLLKTSHWLSASEQSATAAMEKLQDVRFLPFYYHYYTTEAIAVASLATVGLLYAPIGVGTWAARRGPALAAALAFAAAAVVESGKLFGARAHADPTNVLVACACAWLAHRVLGALESGANRRPVAVPLATQDARSSTRSRTLGPHVGGHPVAQLAWLPAMALAAWGALSFPVLPGVLAALLAAAAFVVWKRPALLFLVVPAALPVLDLAPWSGHTLVDEFDLLLLATLATAYARLPAPRVPAARPDWLLRGAAALTASALAIGVVRGLLPWQAAAGEVDIFQSSSNALCVGKGALWALLACGAWRRATAAGDDPRRPLALGAAAGLVLVVAVICWERAAFVGWLDFASDYRVTGPFSVMNIGGAYVECFLVVATPFLMVLILESRHWLSRWTGGALLLAATYALMVTFSRSGQVALAVVAGVVLAARLARRGPSPPRRRVWLAGLAVAMVAVAAPVLRGPFEQARVDTTASDFSLRLRHWKDVIAARPDDWATRLFGNGLGRFAETYYWRHEGSSRSGTYRLRYEPRGAFLRLGSGDPIYVEQFVSIAPDRDYVLRLLARSPSPGARVSVSLCEKWLLASFDCVGSDIAAGAVPGQWQPVEVRFNSGRLAGTAWYAKRPVKLALHNPAQVQVFDVADLQLQGADGRPLLDNGDFSRGMDHWFFSADNHLAWHTKSLPVGIWFDLGWTGVIAFTLLFGVAWARGARAVPAGDARVAGLAALAGFSVLGLFDTLVDSPRFLFVCLGLCALCAARAPSPTRPAAHP